ncbi:MAG: GNAT family N-acetyltransferase [Thermomicrobiales bacterium]|nr:GNAT family N-acetyltransferase [Thermomicrobiales bacterium]
MPHGGAPIITILGEQVAPGPLRRDLIPTCSRWRNDPVVARTMAYVAGPVTLEERAAWFERASCDSAAIRFAVSVRHFWQAIGITNLHGIDGHHGTAEFVLMIGEADARGQGLGTETTRLMLAYAFSSLRLHNVVLRVSEYNHAGIRAYQKAGFREFGRRQQCHCFCRPPLGRGLHAVPGQRVHRRRP